ncbi:MAG: hypothetical protein QNJ44_16980 [Rhodobacter sp.]|nr:hypothetical protein [Rhodobacter sp.]
MDRVTRFMAAMALVLLPVLGHAQEIEDFVDPAADESGFTIDLQALHDDDRLSDAEKALIFAVLEEAPGYIPPPPSNILGIDADCKPMVRAKLFVTGVECAVSLSADATTLIVTEPAAEAVIAVCKPVVLVSLGMLKKVCFTKLMGLWDKSIGNVLLTCADQSKASAIGLGYNIATTKMSARAFCR